jgi:hypothetical protein
MIQCSARDCLDGAYNKNMAGNLIEMVLKLSEEVGHLRKDNEILNMQMKTISTSQGPCVAYAQD